MRRYFSISKNPNSAYLKRIIKSFIKVRIYCESSSSSKGTNLQAIACAKRVSPTKPPMKAKYTEIA